MLSSGSSILIHICCAPCTIHPLKILRGGSARITGFFYNPNIHPYLEFKRRLDTLKEYSAQTNLSVIFEEDYGMRDFLRLVVGHEDDRCRSCYAIRLRKTAETARENGYSAFTTTLLYSRYQKHDLIISIAEDMSRQYAVPFYYHDFRQGWEEGISEAKALKLYRQPYCGCIYSEEERYCKKLRRASQDCPLPISPP
ncbi:MAG: epoxyqueuosine reductase QueH [Pseudomonadota bacterium]